MLHGQLKLSGRSHDYLSSQDGMHLGGLEGHRWLDEGRWLGVGRWLDE